MPLFCTGRLRIDDENVQEHQGTFFNIFEFEAVDIEEWNRYHVQLLVPIEQYDTANEKINNRMSFSISKGEVGGIDKNFIRIFWDNIEIE